MHGGKSHETRLKQLLGSSRDSGQIPLHFFYTSEGAQAHDRLVNAIDQGQSTNRARHEIDVLTRLERNEKYNILCDLGPGNGQHTTAVLAEMAERGISFETYIGMDFSRDLLDIASKRIRASLSPDVPLRFKVSDLDRSPVEMPAEIRRTGPASTLFLLLGNTLGNTSDRVQMLKNIATGCRSSDILVVSVALATGDAIDESLLAPYRLPEFEAMLTEPLVGCNIPKDSFRVGINLVGRTITATIRFTQSVVFSQATDGTNASIERGAVWQCFRSHRFTRQEVEAEFRMAGLRILRQQEYENGSALALVASKMAGSDLNADAPTQRPVGIQE